MGGVTTFNKWSGLEVQAPADMRNQFTGQTPTNYAGSRFLALSGEMRAGRGMSELEGFSEPPERAPLPERELPRSPNQPEADVGPEPRSPTLGVGFSQLVHAIFFHYTHLHFQCAHLPWFPTLTQPGQVTDGSEGATSAVPKPRSSHRVEDSEC